MKLDGQVAVITGAAGHLGSAVTRRFLAEGARVVIGWHVAGGWRLLQSELDAEQADRCLGVQADVTDERQVRRLIKTAVEAWGSIDALLNLAGALGDGRPLWETEARAWDHIMDVNLRSAFLCARCALPAMLRAGKGRIVNVSCKPSKGLHPGAAYAVAKAGIVTLTRALGAELKGSGVAVNAIMPGIMDTPATRKLLRGGDTSRWVKPEQVADLLVALCAGELRAPNGSVLKLPGGA